MLPLAVTLLLAAVAVVLLVVYMTGQHPAQAVNGVTCDSQEHASGRDVVHYHAHLTILVGGTEATVSSNIGIPSTYNCIYWLHTHDTTGVIHVEAPKSAARDFTLGDFFKVWDKPLSRTNVAGVQLSGDQQLVIFVDGKRVDTDPAKIVLKPHEQIVLEVTPPVIDPPPSYTFPPGL